MLFNSIGFAIFLPIIFFLYWFVFTKNYKYQNALLLISSYFFYACWDWRFTFLLVFSTALDYYSGIKMAEAKSKSLKKFYFAASIIINLGFLATFKYYNFFANSFADAVSHFGVHVSPWTLMIILPVGISFYTFHGLSYVIDIYNDKIKPERNFIDYSVFVSFFPLLVAGPIERATHLLPQIQRERTFDYTRAVDGLRQILWGLFKKVVIADQSAGFANLIFNNSANYNGSAHLLGAVFFTFQIYCDFSGYSDIALGTARLFGIELLKNFAFPYFSRDIAEFWRRWHISLSTWFRDYLYIPLGGSKAGTLTKVRNTFIIFIVSGFWHGANWTFIMWGFINALFIMPSILFKTNRKNLDTVAEGKNLPTLRELLSILMTFGLTVFAWIFFRAENISHAFDYLRRLFSKSLFAVPNILGKTSAATLVLVICLFVLIEWFGREKRYAIEYLGQKVRPSIRWAFYYILILMIFFYTGEKQQFIYFQF